jgi:DNA-binding MarR family transcriptional regulator
LLALTPQGAEVLRTIYSLNQEWARHIMARLDPEHLDAVADTLEGIARILETDEQQTGQQKTSKKEERGK